MARSTAALLLPLLAALVPACAEDSDAAPEVRGETSAPAPIAVRPAAAPPAGRVAVLPGEASLGEWISQRAPLLEQGWSAQVLPPLVDERPDGLAVQEGDALVFAQAADELLAREVDAALARPSERIEATSFFVPVDLEERAHVLVLASPEVGPGRRLHPEGIDPRRARMVAGRHVLPRSPISLGAARSGERAVLYQQGYPVLGGGIETRVRIALRATAIEPEELAAIDRLLLAGPEPAATGELDALLLDLGLAVREAIVVAPE